MTTFTRYNYCAKDYYNENGKCFLELYNDENVSLTERCSKYIKIDECSDSAKLNMTTQDYSLAMGTTANFLGFTLIVGIILIFSRR